VPPVKGKIFVVKICIDNSGRNYGITLESCKDLQFKPTGQTHNDPLKLTQPGFFSMILNRKQNRKADFNPKSQTFSKKSY